MKNCFDMDMDETVTQSELTHDKNATQKWTESLLL